MKTNQPFLLKIAGVAWVGMSLLISPEVLAISSLKNIRVTGPDQLELQFDQKIDKSLVRIEPLKEVVQISLGEVSIYPSKIIPAEGQILTKVFAYQYSPKWVRVRLFVKGNPESLAGADEFKSQIKLDPSGKSIRVHLVSPAPVSESQSTSAEAGDSSEDVAKQNLEEKELLEKVIQGNPSTLDAKAPIARQAALPETSESSASVKKVEIKEIQKPLGQAKPLPAFGGVFVKLFLVCFAAVVFAFFVKKIKSGSRKSGVLGMIHRFTGGALSQNAQKLIQVVSMHHLDPKKSIAVVKIGGRHLVLGVANESINLITQFGEAHGDEEDFKGLGGEDFKDFLVSEDLKPKTAPSAAGQPNFSSGPSMIPNVRSRIRSRLEGMKPL